MTFLKDVFEEFQLNFVKLNVMYVYKKVLNNEVFTLVSVLLVTLLGTC